MSDVFNPTDVFDDAEKWPEPNLQPQYFVMHPDGTFTEADPQPFNILGLNSGVVPPKDTIVEWSLTLPGHLSNREMIDRLQKRVAQYEFLLESAPMVTMPEDDPGPYGMGPALARLEKQTAPYAFVHPETWNKLHHGAYDGMTLNPFYKIGKSPTKWVMCALMPKDRLLFTKDPLPGGPK